MKHDFYRHYNPLINYHVIKEYLGTVRPFVASYIDTHTPPSYEVTDAKPDEFPFQMERLLWGDADVLSAVNQETLAELFRISKAFGFLRIHVHFQVEMSAHYASVHLEDKVTVPRYAVSLDVRHEIGAAGLKLQSDAELFGLDLEDHRLPQIWEALRLGFKIGDMVTTPNLRSGASAYGSAVVLSLAPLLLVSRSGDMVWSSDPKPTTWNKVGRVSAVEFDQVEHRSDDKDYGLTAEMIAPFRPQHANAQDRLIAYVMKGASIIENAEYRARQGDVGEAPFGMGYKEGMSYVRGLQAAYQHALEMMAPPKNLAGLGALQRPFDLNQRELNALARCSNEFQEILEKGEEDQIQKYLAATIDQIAKMADDEIRLSEHSLKTSVSQLVLYLTKRDPYRFVDIDAIAQKAFERGVLVQGKDRKMLLGIFNRQGKTGDPDLTQADE